MTGPATNRLAAMKAAFHSQYKSQVGLCCIIMVLYILTVQRISLPVLDICELYIMEMCASHGMFNAVILGCSLLLAFCLIPYFL